MADHDDQDNDSPLNESELPDPADMDQDDGDESAEIQPCPYCAKPLYEQAEICPHCGSHISQEDAPSGKAIWIIVGAIVCLIVVLYLWLR